MILRFHKGQNVDAIVPTAVDLTPNKAPGDVLWQIPADINPSKTVAEEQLVQATDPITGAPLFDETGKPLYETTTDAQGNVTVVTQTVNIAYTLLQNPTIFTPEDIQAVLITPPTIL